VWHVKNLLFGHYSRPERRGFYAIFNWDYLITATKGYEHANKNVLYCCGAICAVYATKKHKRTNYENATITKDLLSKLKNSFQVLRSLGYWRCDIFWRVSCIVCKPLWIRMSFDRMHVQFTLRRLVLSCEHFSGSLTTAAQIQSHY